MEPVLFMDVGGDLCHYDERNPIGAHSYTTGEDVDELPTAREPGCGCDNCFYGRDELAREVLRLQEACGSPVVPGELGVPESSIETERSGEFIVRLSGAAIGALMVGDSQRFQGISDQIERKVVEIEWAERVAESSVWVEDSLLSAGTDAYDEKLFSAMLEARRAAILGFREIRGLVRE